MTSSINIYGTSYKNNKKSYGWAYKLMLFLSFIWIYIYQTASALTMNFIFGFGNLFGQTSFFALVILEALCGWIIFELVFWIYRIVLSFKIYSFVVSLENLKNECRFFYSIKNVFLGIFINLCFFFPYLYSFLQFFDLILIIVMVLMFSYHIQKKYSEPIISHFVFKNFCYPIFLYECIVLIISVSGVLL